jgi:hypothetical protein
MCICQRKATASFRYNNIPISPPELKYKEWDDFTGELKSNNLIRS